MSILKDKVYEEMDWLSQAIQPMTSPIEEVIDKAPDTIPFTQRQLLSELSIYSMSVNTNDIIKTVFNQYLKTNNISLQGTSFSERDFLVKNFKVVLTIDKMFIKKTDDAAGYISKDRKPLENTEALDMMRRNQSLYDLNSRNVRRNSGSKRAAEVKQILFKDSEDHDLNTLLVQWTRKEDFLIKSVDAFSYVVDVVNAYVIHGDIKSFGEIARIKLMLNKGQPIYSFGK